MVTKAKRPSGVGVTSMAPEPGVVDLRRHGAGRPVFGGAHVDHDERRVRGDEQQPPAVGQGHARRRQVAEEKGVQRPSMLLLLPLPLPSPR